MDSTLHLLIIEDNDDLREAMVEALTDTHTHIVAFDCAEALTESPDLPMVEIAIIDVNLPGEDGLSLTRRLRALQPSLGIILATARSTITDKTEGYDAGADLYLTKPVALEELKAAISALRRRLSRTADVAHHATFDPKRMLITHTSGAVIQLNARESALIMAFARAPNQRLETWQIAELLYPTEEFSKSALELHITRIRKKIAVLAADDSAIKAIRNFGYQLCVDLQVQ